MRKIGFVVDSTFGYKGSEDVSVVPLKVIINGYEYVEGEFSNEIVVNAMKEKRDVKTSQPAPSMFVDAFEKQFSNGYDYVICLTISSALSGTINGANVAKNILENENIFIVDTKTASVGSDYILEEALRLANKGKTVHEVINHINEIITKGSLIFSVDDLSTLVKNGRLGKVSALIGSILKIKPILRFKEGVLTVEAKVRGLMAVFKYIKEQVVNLISDNDVIVRITYVDNIEYAKTLEETINNINNKKVNVQIKGILSPVISAHVGLGGMGIYLVTK